jgi:hypothetical protein
VSCDFVSCVVKCKLNDRLIKGFEVSMHFDNISASTSNSTSTSILVFYNKNYCDL